MGGGGVAGGLGRDCYAGVVAKVREIYVCSACGAAQPRWVGKCPDCNAWDSLVKEIVDPATKKDPQRGLVEAWADLSGEPGRAGVIAPGTGAIAISKIDHDAAPARLRSGVAEFDRVLGGGIVAGSAVLVGGAPGIGKSTLLLQAALAMACGDGTTPPTRVLYVCAEESVQQVRLRAERLATGPLPDELIVLADTNLARIVEQTRKLVPSVVVIDSIQMVYKPDVPSGPGSVPQLRRCCAELVYLAKMSGIAVVMVGHITKDGQLAGPRLLEHLVDVVVSFEGDRYHALRLVRGIKNRFGATDEIGLFEMTGAGLREAPEGAAGAVPTTSRPGSVLCPVMTGSRCVLVEIQALTATGFLGAAKRKSSGLDPSRLAMLIAVLESHAELRLADRDIFASSVGGVKVVEPAADLALLLAIAGAHNKRALPPATAVVGEVGLGGEIRAVAQPDARVREAVRLGCTRLVVPTRVVAPKGAEVVVTKTVNDAIGLLGK